jgi:sRNA-binding protein/8-oxo-dGTP pyrophosphatase MutT (NUDIX family)
MQRFRPSVTVAAVIEHEGRFLLVEEHTPEGLMLNNPAGHLEAGESPEQAVVREVLEETGRAFVPEAVLGVYLSRFVRPAPAGGRGGTADVTYLRIAFRGRVGEPMEGRALDGGIVRTLWLTPDEIRAEAARHRSPLVMRCIDDHLAGRQFALDLVHADRTLVEPEVKVALQPPQRPPPPPAPGQPKPPRPPGSPKPAGPRPARAAHNARPMNELPPTGETGAPAPAADAATVDPAQPAADAAPASTEARASAKRPEPTLAETAALLAERFPALFSPGAPKPIKLRIQADIQQRAPGVVPRKALSIFLHRHTTSTPYLRAMVAATQRFDLDGAPAGELSSEHREAAQAELERRRHIVMQRRAAERAAPAPAAGAPLADGAAGAPPGAQPGAQPAAQPHAQARRDRPPRPDRPPRDHRPPRGERPPRDDRPPRPDRGAEHRGEHRGDQRERGGPRAPHPQPERRPPRPDAPPPDLLPDDPERRERALLLRAWEGSTLTQANFCVLKRIEPARFDALIDQARRERAERAPWARQAQQVQPEQRADPPPEAKPAA